MNEHQPTTSCIINYRIRSEKGALYLARFSVGLDRMDHVFGN